MSVPLRWQEPVRPEEPVRIGVTHTRRLSRRARRLRLLLALFAMVMICASAAFGMRVAGMRAQDSSTLRLLSVNHAHARVKLVGATVERSLGFVSVTGN